MNCKVVGTNEWLYPDVFEYKTQSDSIDIHAPYGGYAAAQLFIRGTKPGDKIRVFESGGLVSPECYQLLDTRVQFNASDGYPFAVQPGVDTSAWTTRQAPFRVYDILQPFSQGGNIVEKEVTALYISCKITSDMPSGVHEGALTVMIGSESVSIPTRVTIHRARLPRANRLFTTNWFNEMNMATRYGIEYKSEEWFRMFRKFMILMRRTRQTHILIGLGHVKVIELGDGKYDFDFSEFARIARMAKEEGFQHIELGHMTWKDYVRNYEYYIFYRPDGKQIGADSDEGYNFLAQFLPRWTAFLKAEGIYDQCVQYIGDEPDDKMAPNYRTICGIVRKFMPGMRFRDAVSVPGLRGAVDYWVPLNREYQLHQEVYEHYRSLGDGIWHYTCCAPGGKWLNRFLDGDLLRPRLLHWGNYRFNLEGYLHWGFNYWNHDQPDVREYSNAVINEGHTLLPAGDTHICYPGNQNGPWMSLRAEMMRQGCEDCELLYMIADKDKKLADQICLSSMRAFDDYEEDPAAFEKNYIRLLEAADKL